MIFLLLATVAQIDFQRLDELAIQVQLCRANIIGELGMQHATVENAEKTADQACKGKLDALTQARDNAFRLNKIKILRKFPQFDPSSDNWWIALGATYRSKPLEAKGL